MDEEAFLSGILSLKCICNCIWVSTCLINVSMTCKMSENSENFQRISSRLIVNKEVSHWENADTRK